MVYNGIVKGMGNMKKLYTNFTKEEKALLKQIFKEINIKDVTIVNHARERMESKGITESDIYNCLRSFDVIELHQKDWDIRLLLRGRAKDTMGRNTCVSLSLITKRIITAYKNYSTDGHSTLREEEYIDVDVKYKLEKVYQKLIKKCLTVN